VKIVNKFFGWAITSIFVLVLTGCTASQNRASDTFNSLLTLVEEGEATLESGKTNFAPAQSEFLNCLVDQVNTKSIECGDELLRLESVFDQTLEEYEFQALIAKMNSLRLVENDSASAARDAFVTHLEAWRDLISDFNNTLPTVEELYEGQWDFLKKWESIGEDDLINKSFQETCSSLGNAQPTDTDEFADRIIDICDE
jgi:hypothetical protein